MSPLKGVVPMLSVEVSLYPIECQSADDVINNSLQVLGNHRVTYDVGPVSTYITGDDRIVWQGLQDLFEQARRLGGEVSMVMTVTNAQV
jgi:uncharacterized protein YqgV (UPF0045/DUF77 family)